MKYLPKNKKVIFVAFSKAIQEELRERIPSQHAVATLHSTGLRAIKKLYGNFVKIEKDKKKIILNPFLDNLSNELQLIGEVRAVFISNVFRMVSIGQQNLTANPDELNEQAEKLGLSLIGNEANYVRECMKKLDNNKEMIDFDDMIYLPAAYDKFPVEPYDFVYLDEAQDLNVAQLKLARKMFSPDNGGRLIAVGDPQQAIFGFAGSDERSFKNIATLPNTKTLPLSVSYRCAKNIIQYVRSKTGVNIDAWEKSPDGEVNETGLLADIKDGDMVICRTTAPLIALCMKFIRDKKAAYIRGRDVGETLINEINKYVGKKSMDKEQGFAELYGKIDNEIEKSITRQMNRGLTREQAMESTSVVNLTERKECYIALRDESNTPLEMIDNIKKIFSDTKHGGIQLTSAHRSKGLEADNVHIAEDDLLKGVFAKNDFQKTQENNLRYVAYTRAKKKLSFISDWTFYKKKKEKTGNGETLQKSTAGEETIEKSKFKEYEIIEKDGKTMFQLKDTATLETEEPKESTIHNYLSGILKMKLNDKQKQNYQQQLDNLKLCYIVAVSSLSSKIEVGHPQVKACFKNAAQVCIDNDTLDIKYVEGYVSIDGLSVLHAWNKLGNQYFDVTAEGPLAHIDEPFNEYGSIIEVDKVTLAKFLIDSGSYESLMEFNKII